MGEAWCGGGWSPLPLGDRCFGEAKLLGREASGEIKNPDVVMSYKF